MRPAAPAFGGCARLGPVSAESAYVFRHALLRDAAYQLQLPGTRTRLHGLALSCMEAAFGGRPEPAAPAGGEPHAPHASDPFARELAGHARLSGAPAGLVKGYLCRAAEHAEAAFRMREAEELWVEVAATGEGPGGAEALRRAAVAAYEDGRNGAAELRYRDALGAARRCGDRGIEGFVVGGLAALLRECGRPDDAASLFREALDLHGDRGTVAEGGCRSNFGDLLLDAGRMAEAKEQFERSLAIFRRSGGARHVAAGISSLAVLAARTGRLEEAERGFREALALAKSAGDRRREAQSLGNLGSVLLQLRRPAEAEAAISRARELHRAMGSRRNEAHALGNLGILRAQARELAAAAQRLEEAVRICREVGDRVAECGFLANLGSLYSTAGDVPRALRAYEDARDLSREVRNRRSEGLALMGLGEHHSAEGNAGEAESAYREAAAIWRELGVRAYEGVALGGLAGLRAKDGRLDDADRLFAGAIDLHVSERDRRFEGLHRCEHGLVLLALGRADEARETWRRGAEILREDGLLESLEKRVAAMADACAAAGVGRFDARERPGD